jgi:hypothetical protein
MKPRKRVICSVLVCAALLTVPAQRTLTAQMPITVQRDRVLLGHHAEHVPRFVTYLANTLVVPKGQTVTLPPQSTYDAIEVAGTLRVSRTFDTTVRFTHLVILPGGRLDSGTEDDPVLRRVTFIIRDVPIDTTRDPFQWGNGIINFGSQSRVGRAKTTWTQINDVDAGAMRITADDVGGWQVGDELLLPDMAQRTSRRETPVVITRITGNVVELSKPLDFEHLSIRDPDGGLVLRPRVANLTRNIVIRSEAPGGTRGHTANIGESASWDVRYNQFVAVGRTKAEPLDSTSADGTTHIGANQIGKYADHDHHAQGFGSKHIGNSYVGHFGSKWSVAVHGTHDVLVENNVCIDFMGGCYATEDGYEVRNVFRNNVAAYTLGNNTSEDRNIALNNPGAASAYWFRGIGGMVIDTNESWNNHNDAGLNIFNIDHVGIGTMYPSKPGGPMDTPFDPKTSLPASVRGNVDVGNSIGLEIWGSGGRIDVYDHIAAHNTERQVYPAPGARSFYRNLRAIGDRSAGKSICVASSAAYVPSIEIEDSQLRGCEYGLVGGFANEYGRFTNVLMQNEINVEMTGHMVEAVFTNVTHRPLGSYPPKYYVVIGHSDTWTPGRPFTGFLQRRDEWLLQRRSPWAVVNHNGTGQNFRLLAVQQHGSAPAWPGIDRALGFLVPEEGLTMREAWEKYGMAFRGDVYEHSEVLRVEGVINGVARPGLDRPLGPPRLVLTAPNMLAPALVTGGVIQMQLLMTGQPSSASDVRGLVSIDGGPAVPTKMQYQPGDQRLRSSATHPGTHTVTTWRLDEGGRPIPSSEMTFCYYVDAPTTPCRPPSRR